jgi:uncharacterized protein YciI
VKKFIALIEKKNSNPAPRDLMLKHIDHLKALRKTGILFLCGLFHNENKVIQILNAADMAEADALVRRDPFTVSGFFADYTIHELIEANEENNYLLKD